MSTEAGTVMAPVSARVAKLLHQLQAQIIREADDRCTSAEGTLTLLGGGKAHFHFGSVSQDQYLVVSRDCGHEVTLYRNHLPMSEDSRKHWHPAHWWGSEKRRDASGEYWSRSLPHLVMNDFGDLVAVAA